MANYVEGSYVTREAGADLSGAEFHVMKTDANSKVVKASAGTDAIMGVLEQGAKAGDSVSVAVVSGAGTYKVKVGTAAVAKDALLTSNANGRAVTAATGDRVFGRAVTAGAAGDIVEYVKHNEKA